MRSKNQKGKLIIFDGYFPCLKTGFRIAEYNDYLQKYQSSEVYSYCLYFDTFYREYVTYYPQFKDRVKPFKDFDENLNNVSLFYTVFLTDAYGCLPIFEKCDVPFVFTLYPGGGFWINDDTIDHKLLTVCRSPLLKKVIVTQQFTYDYIVEKGFIRPDRVEFIYGMVTHPEYFKSAAIPKKIYGQNKSTFDVCFVANKYMPKGIDKGYDIFIEVCKRLTFSAQNIRFHVVGNFDGSDVDVGAAENRIAFYGQQNGDFFPDFYSKMDIILSPNVPFKLIPGKSFDGFPTGCCMDAALNGVAVLCTDELHQNKMFEDQEEIHIINTNPDDIAHIVMGYYHNPDLLYRLSQKGCEKFRKILDFDEQMNRRAAVLNQYLEV